MTWRLAGLAGKEGKVKVRSTYYLIPLKLNSLLASSPQKWVQRALNSLGNSIDK